MRTFAQLCGMKDFHNITEHMNWKGGSTATSESGIAKEFLPELKAITAEGKDLYESGKLGKVAPASSIQQGVFDYIQGGGAAGLGKDQYAARAPEAAKFGGK